MPNLDKDYYLDKQGLRQLVNELETNIVAEEYDSSATYALGDYCIHDNKLYRCTTAISTAESWTSGHWSQVIVGDEIKNKSLAGLSDVTLSSPSDKECLVYDSNDSKWENKPIPQTWSGTQAEYDAIPYPDPNTTYYITDSVSPSLQVSNLTDVALTNITNGQTLVYQNGTWVNDEAGGKVWQGTQAQYDAITTPDPDMVYYITDSTQSNFALADLSNVSLSTPTAGQSLVYSNGQWVNQSTIWKGTQAQYNAINTPDPNVTYFITDGTVTPVPATNISYNNTTSGLSATQVQSAIDEVSFEIGSSGVWTWRKWKNGILELWGNSDQIYTGTFNSWGNVFSLDVSGLGSYPIPFVRIDTITGSCALGGANASSTLTNFNLDNLLSAPGYIMLRGTNIGSDNRRLVKNLYVKGTWK